jgi:hypothetical protein
MFGASTATVSPGSTPAATSAEARRRHRASMAA